MATTKNELILEDGETRPKGMDLVSGVIDPQIAKFEEYFKTRGAPGGLARYEREILRSFAWWQLEEQCEGE